MVANVCSVWYTVKQDEQEGSEESVKKNDIYLMVAVCALAFIIWLMQHGNTQSAGSVITVRQDGELIGTYSLAEDNTLTFKDTQGGENVLEICDGEARMLEADCPDQLCVKQKVISRKGESIICLPHRLVIEVTEGEENTVDAVVG